MLLLSVCQFIFFLISIPTSVHYFSKYPKSSFASNFSFQSISICLIQVQNLPKFPLDPIQINPWIKTVDPDKIKAEAQT